MSQFFSIVWRSFVLSLYVLCFNISDASGEVSLSQNFTLSNGMKVIVIPNHRVPAISHMVWYRVGAVDEKPGKSGLAHFLEHLMFKETIHLTAGEFSSLMAYYGANENAGTSLDYTVYYQTIAKDYLEVAMLLEAERMTQLTLQDAEIATERAVVLEERSSRIDNNPRSKLIEKMFLSLYQEHPYGTPTIGWRTDVENLTKEDITDFYQSYYHPNNAILVVSGDITAEELAPLAEKYYGSFPMRMLPVPHTVTMPETPSQSNIVYKDPKVNKPEWIRYYPAPSARKGQIEHVHALSVLAQILGGGETSRLYQRLVISDQLAVEANAYYDELARYKTTFSIYVLPNDGVEPEEIASVIEDEITTLVNEGIDADELERAINLLSADAIYARDGLQKIAFIYGRAHAVGVDSHYIEKWPDNIAAITSEEVIAAAKHVLDHHKAVTGILKKAEH